jgi:hypothetical protein
MTMKYRDHAKIVTRLQESHAAQLRLERSRSARVLLSYCSSETIARIATAITAQCDAGAPIMLNAVECVRAMRSDGSATLPNHAGQASQTAVWPASAACGGPVR